MSARIAELYVYPVKGCRGVALDAATCAATGLTHEDIGDREWVIVDADGEFLSQRSHPRMALIETRLTSDSLRLKAPGMLQLEVPYESEGDVLAVRVWDDRISAVTQGDLADAWLSEFLRTPCRLMRFDPEHRRLAKRLYTGDTEAPYKFADAFALLVTNRASLAEVNVRLERQGAAAITMARFRPNVVIEGIEAFEEDHVRELRIGALTLRLVKPCARCTVPGVDPATGEQGTVVPDVLATFRQTDNGVMFGVNAIVAAGADAQLRVGDAVEAELNFS
jgi:hypothetical protein